MSQPLIPPVVHEIKEWTKCFTTSANAGSLVFFYAFGWILHKTSVVYTVLAFSSEGLSGYERVYTNGQHECYVRFDPLHL